MTEKTMTRNSEAGDFIADLPLTFYSRWVMIDDSFTAGVLQLIQQTDCQKGETPQFICLCLKTKDTI